MQQRSFMVSSILLALVTACLATTATAMPHNARQVVEGYWVGGEPELAEIPELVEAGIEHIVSAVYVNQRRIEAYDAAGLTYTYIRITSRFPDVDTFLGALDGRDPATVYLHCDHGADRAGAMAAFALVALHDWRPDHALLAVATPSRYQLNRVIAVLEEFDLVVTSDERETYGGIYSGQSNGGTGGLKAHEESYQRLVRTTVQAMGGLGVTLEEGSDGLPVGGDEVAGDEVAGDEVVEPSTVADLPL